MMADSDLSDEQISELLRGAQHRLIATSQSRNTSKSSPSLPSLQKSLTTGTSEAPQVPSYIKSTTHGALIDPALLVNPEERKVANSVRRIADPVLIKSSSSKTKKSDAGSDWYNLPRTVLTPELKRDLQLLRMRDVLDSKRHYKKDNSKAKVPEFSQVGTIIEGPTEFFSARLSNKDRKRTFVEEVLAGETSTHRFKSKYNDIQAAKTSGKKAYYKKMKELRRGGGSKG